MFWLVDLVREEVIAMSGGLHQARNSSSNSLICLPLLLLHLLYCQYQVRECMGDNTLCPSELTDLILAINQLVNRNCRALGRTNVPCRSQC